MLLFAALLHLLVCVHSWVNDYDHPFTFTCPQHQSIQRVVSHHDNHREDRVFDFTCSNYEDSKFDSCYWTEYVNDFDQPVIFQCPHGGVLNGVSSYHDNHKEDRRFRFYCCESPGNCLFNCYYSGLVNQYDGDLDYTVPDGHVMRGWTSVHDNHHEDRVFDFDVCRMQQCLDTGNPGETVIGK
ncbi:hemagglutinin/amebocyte aggregation factor [Magallana gigas]|uniref:hemagglutinin/amebocyte aggregation factor n=1 Tax=Magallana gigas TaxID=29159 RepID=UPI00333FDF06